MVFANSLLISLTLFGGAFIVSAIELSLQKRWNARYYRLGIKALNRIVGGPGGSSAPDPEQLEREFGNHHYNWMTFQRLDHGTIAFREKTKAKNPGHSVLLHGRIVRDEFTGQVRVEGRLNWLPIWSFPLIWYWMYVIASRHTMPTFVLILIVFFPIVMFIFQFVKQLGRYNKIADFLENSGRSRRHPR